MRYLPSDDLPAEQLGHVFEAVLLQPQQLPGPWMQPLQALVRAYLAGLKPEDLVNAVKVGGGLYLLGVLGSTLLPPSCDAALCTHQLLLPCICSTALHASHGHAALRLKLSCLCLPIAQVVGLVPLAAEPEFLTEVLAAYGKAGGWADAEGCVAMGEAAITTGSTAVQVGCGCDGTARPSSWDAKRDGVQGTESACHT